MKTKAEDNNTMREEIITHIDNPRQLEKLYREDKTIFKTSFKQIYPQIMDNTTAQVWNERLNFEHGDIAWGTRNDFILVLTISFIAGLIAKIPHFFSVDENYYYARNIAFVVFPMLTVYFGRRRHIPMNKVIAISIAIILSALYINILPDNDKSYTLILACIHLPLILWAILGFTFGGGVWSDPQKRLDFLKYNADLVVLIAILCIAGMALSGITIGLFKLIGLNIGEFYFKNIAIWGLAAIPIIGTHLVRSNPQLVNKVSPIVARVFTPLVLLMLVIYLVAVLYTGKDPYNDREFLLIFNVLLVGVMAIIFFSIAETAKNSANTLSTVLLSGLSVTTIIVNGIALSAILFRIYEYGITPNRLAVLGSNALMLTNLVIIMYKLFRTFKDKNEISSIEDTIASFIPFYVFWAIVVTFLFPVVFGFK